MPIEPVSGVRTAYADAEHMRLYEALVGPRHAGIVGEPIDPATGELREWRGLRHLSGPDPDDLWATPLPEGGEAA